MHEELLSTIGTVAKTYPAIISNPSDLQNTLINQLNREVQKSSTNRSYLVIAGAVSALSDFLENYPIGEHDNSTAAGTIYKCVKLLADPGDASRRIAFRGNFNLFKTLYRLRLRVFRGSYA